MPLSPQNVASAGPPFAAPAADHARQLSGLAKGAPSYWGALGVDGGAASAQEPARVYNLSCMRAPLRTPRLHSLVPLGSGLRDGGGGGGSHFFTCVAAIVGWESSRASVFAVANTHSKHEFALRLRIDDGVTSVLCDVCDPVVEDLLDTTPSEFARLGADEQRRTLDARLLLKERKWALTLASMDGAGARLWRIDATAAFV